MPFKVRRLDFKTGGPAVAVLDNDLAYKLGVSAKERVKLIGDNDEVVVTVDISQEFIKRDEIGIFRDVWEMTRWKDGDEIDIEIVETPPAADFIRKKLEGKKLNRQEIKSIVHAVAEDKLMDLEIASFLISQHIRSMNLNELTYLVDSMVQEGEKLNLEAKTILDKHSLGGMPGNKVTMIVVPFIASLGYTIPKTSSRAITSAAGTADAMEVLANVSFSPEELKKIIAKTGGCIAWGGTLNLAPVDDKLIKVEKALRIDPESQMIASIMAKKISVGATHLILDFPVGPYGKLKSRMQAKILEKKFRTIGNRFGMKIKAVCTEGIQPIGNGIGPLLSARDALMVLEGKGPDILKSKALKICDNLLSLVSKRVDTEKHLKSGKPLEKFREIIEAQGGDPDVTSDDLVPDPYEFTYTSGKTGFVREIRNDFLIKIARVAGAPLDKKSGIYVHKHIGEKVTEGDPLFTIYAKSSAKLKRAVKYVVLDNPFTVRK
jgi:AMP phosphorylase